MGARILMIVSGIVLIIGGVFALVLPGLASITATLIVAWALILAGVLHIIEGAREALHRWWNLGFGIVALLLGISFAVNPLSGALSLTITLGALFFVSGVLQLYLAWKQRQTDSVWMLVISGGLSILLAVLIALNLFTAAVTVPGIILAIELISTGLALILMRPSEKKLVERAEKASDEIPA
jgi:uncharacterized membrane protein HdeD (DUF308 family)